MDNYGASSQGLEVCTQEKSIITLTKEKGATSNQKRGKKKTKEKRWRTWYKAVFL